MRRKSLVLGSAFLAAAFVAPTAMQANPVPQVSVQVYDRDHKDYHKWDDRETRSYEEYRRDHPKYAVEFSKNNRKQQSEYWKWRHEHPDHD